MAKWAKNIRAVPSRPNKTITGLLILLHGNTLRTCLVTDHRLLAGGKNAIRSTTEEKHCLQWSVVFRYCQNKAAGFNSPWNISPCEQRMIPLPCGVVAIS